MNIKEFYGIDDLAYPEAEIYRFYKNNTSWKWLVLKVRFSELLQTLYPRLFKFKSFQPYIDMVNKWEK